MNNSTVLYNDLQIKELVQKLADELNSNLSAGSQPRPVFIILLNGGAFLGVDLTRNIEVAHETIFATIKRTDEGTQIELTGDEKVFVSNRHVIIVDEFLDTGGTIKSVAEKLNSKGANSITIAALLVREKQTLSKLQSLPSIKNIFYGDVLKIKNWLFGYGLNHPSSTTGSDYRSLMEIRSINK